MKLQNNYADLKMPPEPPSTKGLSRKWLEFQFLVNYAFNIYVIQVYCYDINNWMLNVMIYSQYAAVFRQKIKTSFSLINYQLTVS